MHRPKVDSSNLITSGAVAPAFLSVVVQGQTISSNTHTFVVNSKINLHKGVVLRLLIESCLQSSVAITTVNINYNGTIIPIVSVKDGNKVNIASKHITAGKNYNSAYPYRWCQGFTWLELVYDGTNFIVRPDIIMMNYVSGDSAYTVYASGFIEQYGKDSRSSTGKYSVLLLVHMSNTNYNMQFSFERTDGTGLTDDTPNLMNSSAYPKTVSSFYIGSYASSTARQYWYVSGV